MDPQAENSVRSFVAAELPSEARTALAQLVETLNWSDIKGLRTVRPDGIHLTLKFLGDVPVGRLDVISDALVRVCRGHPRFTLRLGDAGTFPARGSPRVLWIGLDGEVEQLRALQRQLDLSLALQGFAGEPRAFSPHLTVARFRDGASAGDRRRAAEFLDSGWSVQALAFPVTDLSLIRSTLRTTCVRAAGGRFPRTGVWIGLVYSDSPVIYFARLLPPGKRSKRRIQWSRTRGPRAAHVPTVTCCPCLILEVRAHRSTTRLGSAATPTVVSTSRSVTATSISTNRSPVERCTPRESGSHAGGPPWISSHHMLGHTRGEMSGLRESSPAARVVVIYGRLRNPREACRQGHKQLAGGEMCWDE